MQVTEFYSSLIITSEHQVVPQCLRAAVTYSRCVVPYGKVIAEASLHLGHVLETIANRICYQLRQLLTNHSTYSCPYRQTAAQPVDT